MKLSIQTKMLSAFAVVLITMGIVGWQGVAGMRDIKQDMDEIKYGQLAPSQMIAEANIALLAWSRATLNHVLAESMEKMVEYEEIMIAQKFILLDRLDKLSKTEHLSLTGKQLVRKVKDEFLLAEPIRDRVLALSRGGNQEEARQLKRNELRPIVDTMDTQMTKFFLLQAKQLEKALKLSDERYEKGFRLISWVIVTAVLVSFFIFFFLSRGILKSIHQMVQGSKSAAVGDFEKAKIVITSKDEFNYLAIVFNQMIETIKNSLASLERAKVKLKAQNAELMQSNKALDEFAYTVSHDLKEPLRGIRFNASIILEDCADKLDKKNRPRLTRMMQLTQRLDDLIESILYYSRLGRVQLSFSECDLNREVQEVLDSLKFSLDKSGIKIQMPHQLPAIVCDSVRVKEIFSNLISNAIKYNDKPEKCIEIGFDADKNPFVFYVRDNGIGIKEKHQEKIFKIFKRLHGRDKYGGGQGVGLTIVKKIIERHAGKIWVESGFGEGTSFYFTLQKGEP